MKINFQFVIYVYLIRNYIYYIQFVNIYDMI